MPKVKVITDGEDSTLDGILSVMKAVPVQKPVTKAYLRLPGASKTGGPMAKSITASGLHVGGERIARYKQMVKAWRARAGNEPMPVHIKSMIDQIEWHESHYGSVD